jgi:hypothetical protein
MFQHRAASSMSPQDGDMGRLTKKSTVKSSMQHKLAYLIHLLEKL